MVRSFRSPHPVPPCAHLWSAAGALGFAVVVAIGGCNVDRTGLQQVQLPDDAGSGTMVRGDAPAEATSVDGTGGQRGVDGIGGGSDDGAGGGGGAGLDGAGGGGANPGTGGSPNPGTGGAIGTGGGGGRTIGAGGIGNNVGTGGGGNSDAGMVGTGGLGDGGPGGTPYGTGGMNGTGGIGDAGATTGTGGGGAGGLGGGGGAGGTSSTGCTPATCANGCCAGVTCITSLSAQQCGHGGGACQACAPCDRCSVTGACELEPTSLWDLWAVSATLNPIDPNVKSPASTTWDLDSGEVGGPLPDPFVELDILAPAPAALITLGHTATIVDTLFPNWSGLSPATQGLLNPLAPLAASDLMGGRPWLIVVGDDDVGVASATTGETMCEIDGALVPTDFRNGTFTRVGVDDCFSATFRLTCHM